MYILLVKTPSLKSDDAGKKHKTQQSLMNYPNCLIDIYDIKNLWN